MSISKWRHHFNLKNPVLWFGLFMLVYSYFRFDQQETLITIRSDARGYYAYLPALLTYNDPTFRSSTEAELRAVGSNNEPDYLVETADGKTHNKYFPGVALLQSPFYMMASVMSQITGKPADGYSFYYQVFFQVGSLFYAILGLFLLSTFLARLYPEAETKIRWMIPLLYVATPLFQYSANTMSFSHNYSIAVFSLFGLLVLGLRENTRPLIFFKLGLTLGLIFLIRPTNLIVVLMVPFLLGSKEELYRILHSLLANRWKHLIVSLTGFFLFFLVLLIVWKWESGSFFVWSYSGEGFNFLAPQFMAAWFSFRVGLFLHTPIMLLVITGVVLLFKKDRFKGFWWTLYFLLNTWIIASWWCWDYESAFGNRPFAEHFVFLLLPLIPLLLQRNVFIYALTGIFVIVGSIRIYTFYNGFMSHQRFTASNYVPSLMFWKDNNFQRWQFTRSCPPFGEEIEQTKLFEHEGIIQVNPQDIHLCGGSMQLKENRTNERYYFQVHLEKKVNETPFEEVMLIVDASNDTTNKRYYYPVRLFNDKYEGLNTWTPLTFEGLIPDNLHQLNELKIYIFNPKGMKFQLRNVRTTVGLYKS